MSPQWKPLHCHDGLNDTIPPLLVKYEIGASSYKIWVTDLIRVWTEKLEQRPLVQRAWDIETDIDPIESDQRQLLLQKIKDSLNEVSGTKLALTRHGNTDDIQLTAFSPLPKPFKALQWPFHLTPSAQISLTNELVLPSLNEQLLSRKKIQGLLEILKEKDYVIGKLTDKLLSEGTDLSKVFPGAVTSKSRRLGSSKEELGKSVKGLGSFDEVQWQTQYTNHVDIPSNRRDVFSQLFSVENSVGSITSGEQMIDEAWWERMNGEAPLVEDIDHAYSQNKSQTSTAVDFQRQSTPDHISSSGHGTRNDSTTMTLPQRGVGPLTKEEEPSDDGSTTEASDEDLESEPPKLSESKQALKPKSEESSSDRSSSPESVPKPGQNSSSRPKGVLGNIGGASKPSVSPSKPKIGRIGGATANDQSSALASRSSEPKAGLAKQPEKPPLPRETSQERADKKREQLKRELEEKSKLGVKKKRKF